jgi:hypothetical protein
MELLSHGGFVRFLYTNLPRLGGQGDPGGSQRQADFPTVGYRRGPALCCARQGCQGVLDRRREIHRKEVIGWVEIVFVRIVDDAEEAAAGRRLVRKDPIELAELEILAILIANADDEVGALKHESIQELLDLGSSFPDPVTLAIRSP